MQSLMSVWEGLDARRRFIVLGATIVVFVAVALMARGGGPGEMALLYAGLDPAAAGEVVAALEARGIAYEARGDAVWVPVADRDRERMALAAEGLPTSSSQGYELLDSLSGFGTTSQMFDAAYWRAKEGELARTILAVPNVQAARVHIAAASSRPFRREDAATAAVTVTTRGAALSVGQAQALRHLIAAAVPGLAPRDVAVIDGEGGLVAFNEEGADQSGDARSADLRERAQRLLEARVGVGKAVVEVSVETVTETEQITERRFDPESRVAISTESEENESTSQGQAGGAVTVASNLPDGEAATGSGPGPSSGETESRTVTNYEVSETSREVLRTPGAVRRLTVAVLVDDIAGVDAGGLPMTTPRPEEELASLSELVASAVGLDPSRGDVLTIRSMPFEPLPALGTEAIASGASGLGLMALARPVILAVVALVLGLFVVRPILRPGPAPLALPGPQALLASQMPTAGSPAALGYAGAFPPAGTGQGVDGRPALPSAIAEAEIVDPVARLRRLIETRQEETAQILQSWIDDVPATATAVLAGRA